MKKWQGDLVFILIVALAIGGWFSLYPRQGDSLLSPLTPPVELNIEPRIYASPYGERLAYRLYEPPGEVDAVLVLLHDTLLHGAWYAELGYGLAKEGIAVYAPDRRGWGHSIGDHRQGAQDVDVLMQDIEAMIFAAHARYPLKELFLGGHGRGAGLVLQYVNAQRPVSGVVLIAPYIADGQPNLDRAGWRQFVQVHPVEAFLAQSGLFDWPVWRYQWPKSMTEVDPLLETTGAISWMRETTPDDLEAAFAVPGPLLCVYGDADPLFDADKAPDLLDLFATPDKQLELVAGADYLGVLTAGVKPIADWVRGR